MTTAGACVLLVLFLVVGAGGAWFAWRTWIRHGPIVPGANVPVVTAQVNSPQIYEDAGLPKRAGSPAQTLFNYLVFRDVKRAREVLHQHPELAHETINGTTALAIACGSRLVPLVEAVLEHHPDLTAKTSERWSMMWVAVSAGSVPVVQKLIDSGCNPLALEEDGETLLWAAPDKPMAKFLIGLGVKVDARDKSKDTAIHSACRHSWRDVVELLLDSGLSVEEKGHWEMPPLHSAASTTTGDSRPVVILLLLRGADINSKGYNGHTALHEAAFFNRLEMADLLLSRGAEANVKDNDGRTPKDLAILAGKQDRIRIINLLIKHGAPGVITPINKAGDDDE